MFVCFCVRVFVYCFYVLTLSNNMGEEFVQKSEVYLTYVH
jgi:hypothetical protein